MKFQPKSENEIAEANLMAPGEYDFEVVKAEDGVSKKGNDMMVLEVRVYDMQGAGRTIFDYLVDTVGAAYKTRHFSEAVGLLDQYERGELLPRDAQGRTGRCKVIVSKDRSGQYPDKNSIADYIKQKDAARPTQNGGVHPPRPMTVELDDEIPF